MEIAVLGTGMVGRALATRLASLGHRVTMGSRSASNEHALTWAASAGASARAATFADASAAAELVVNATSGSASLAALESAGSANLEGKVLVDVANPIAPGTGFPPALSVCNTDSLGEQIQRAFPGARVVKTLNTVTADVMVDPGRVPGRHNVFLSGDDADAKAQVAALLQSLGWPAEAIVDLGDISTARGPEMYLALWLRLMRVVGHPHFNVEVQRPQQ